MKPPLNSVRRITAAVLFYGLAAAACPGNSVARDMPSRTPEPVTSARVVNVIDGDTIVIDAGAEVRLTGIQAPKLPLGRKGFRPWPLAAEAKKALERVSLRREIALEYTGRKVDRWGRLLAHVRRDGVWLQVDMLRRGLARVYTFPDNRSHAAALYRAERTARAAKRGIWALDWYRIREPGETESKVGTFQLVEGGVVDAAIVRGRGYINFGPDWRTDFTVEIAPRHLKTFRAAGLDIRSLKNRRIRVRGWVLRRNGPMIAATHPEQIEVLAQ